jgi:hypothetical protein
METVRNISDYKAVVLQQFRLSVKVVDKTRLFDFCDRNVSGNLSDCHLVQTLLLLGKLMSPQPVKIFPAILWNPKDLYSVHTESAGGPSSWSH